MAFVVSVASRKGGAGKSTVAANLAVALAASGDRVALLDTDPQGTVTRWRAARPGDATALEVEAVPGWRASGAVDRHRRGPGWVLLDTPPHDDTDARAAVRAADLVLVPLQPSLPDLWAVDGTLALASEERKPVALVLNRLPHRTRLRAEVEAEIARRGLPLLPAPLGDRVAFAHAFARGLGVVEDEPRGPAAAEARALAEAVRREAS